MRQRTLLLLAVVALLAAALLTTGCGNAEVGSDRASKGGATSTTAGGHDLDQNVPSDQPGVTDTAIKVGGVASTTNPLGGNYDRVFQGVKAYFAMVNERGGIYGRQLQLVDERDDQLARNQEEVKALLAEDIFAVMPVATPLFTGADTLAASGVPTFGWNINQEWSGPPNLFGERGSFVCFDCPRPDVPWLAKETGRSKVAIVAYNVPQSADCAKGLRSSFEKWPTAKVVFEDTALTYGITDFKVQVDKMRDAGVDLVAACLDTNGVTNLQRELRKQKVDTIQSLVNAYNPEFVQNFGDLFDGSYVMTWAMPNESADPVPALTDYLDWIDRTGGKRDELSMAGWLNADLFYKGLVAAGPEFTRQSVIDAINQMKWDADGLIPGVDWATGHDADTDEACYSYVKIEGGKFVPEFQEPGKPFVCFDRDDATLPDQPERSAGIFR